MQKLQRIWHLMFKIQIDSSAKIYFHSSASLGQQSGTISLVGCSERPAKIYFHSSIKLSAMAFHILKTGCNWILMNLVSMA